MAGFILQEGATVKCVHGGQAAPSLPSPAVTIEGMAVSLLPDPWLVAGCPGVPPLSVPPCVSARWATGTTRVTSYGQALVVQSGTAVCAPTGTPLLPLIAQTRVMAT